MESNKPSFLRDHADTLAIIGVNVAIAAILISLWVSNSHRIDATNARIDQLNARSDALYAQLASTNDRLYELVKERR